MINETSQETPVAFETDVIVCGGGSAGVGVALAAARNGSRTIVLGNQICSGGMLTAGMINRLGPYHDQKDIILGGIPWEILRILISRGLSQEPVICAPKNWMNYWLVFDTEGMKLLLDELLLETGVKVLFALK